MSSTYVEKPHANYDGDVVFVRWFRDKSGKIIHASSYGKKCFVFPVNRKASSSKKQ